MRTTLRFVAVLLLLAACGEGPLQAGRFAMDGRWVGRGFPYELALELEQDGDNRVSGTGEIRGLRERLTLDTLELDPLTVDTTADTLYTDTVRVEVGGTWEFPTFTLALTADGFAGAAYAATYVRMGDTTLADSLTGRLEGSGFANHAVPIGRVRE